MDEYDEAKTVGEEALKYAVESGDPFTQGICSGLLLARTACNMGHFEQAKRYYSQGIEYFEAADRAFYVCMASNEVVLALVASGDLEAAGRSLHRAMSFFVKNRIGYQIIAALTSATTLIAAQGQLEDAVKLLALVITHPAGLHGGWKQAQMLLTDLQTKLHPDVFATAYEAGKTLHLETAAAGLLQELQSKYLLS
jgi:hypothetical protein